MIPPRDSKPLKLEQTATVPLYAISRIHAGDYRQAAQLFERILTESPGIPRRPVHIPTYARAFLAACYQRLGNEANAKRIVERSLQLAARERELGIERFPPLTREIVKAHALPGEREKALESQFAAIEQGRRQYYLELESPVDPVVRLFADDVHYSRSVEPLIAEIDAMRRAVRQDGLALTPEEVLSGVRQGTITASDCRRSRKPSVHPNRSSTT